MIAPTDAELSPKWRWHVERRLRELYVSPDLVFNLAKHGISAAELVEGLPADAELIEAGFDEYRGLFVLVVGSSEFSPVGQRTRLPEVTVTFRSIAQ